MVQRSVQLRIRALVASLPVLIALFFVGHFVWALVTAWHSDDLRDTYDGAQKRAATCLDPVKRDSLALDAICKSEKDWVEKPGHWVPSVWISRLLIATFEEHWGHLEDLMSWLKSWNPFSSAGFLYWIAGLVFYQMAYYPAVFFPAVCGFLSSLWFFFRSWTLVYWNSANDAKKHEKLTESARCTTDFQATDRPQLFDRRKYHRQTEEPAHVHDSPWDQRAAPDPP